MRRGDSQALVHCTLAIMAFSLGLPATIGAQDYTYGFMQRMAEKPRALMPIGWQ